MRFRYLSHKTDLVRGTRTAGKFSALALAAALGMEGMVAGPLHAAPTIGGDDSGPRVRILQPNYQDVLKGKTGILIAVQASKFNPEFVEILVDDKVILTPTKLSDFPSARFDWDTKVFTDGPHKLTVRVTDTQGFRGWAEVVVYINNLRKPDNTPPSLSWLNVKPYQQISGTAKIQLEALDNFGVKWIIVAVNPDATPTQKPPLRSWMISRPPYTINFDTTTLPDGLYRLSAQAWDSREQEGVAPGLTVGIVNNPIVSTTTVGETLEALRQSDINASARGVAGTRTSPLPEVRTTEVRPAEVLNTEVKTPEVKTPEVKAPEVRVAGRPPVAVPEVPAGQVSARSQRSGVRTTVTAEASANAARGTSARAGRTTVPGNLENEVRPLLRTAGASSSVEMPAALSGQAPQPASVIGKAPAKTTVPVATNIAPGQLLHPAVPTFPNVSTGQVKAAGSTVKVPQQRTEVARTEVARTEVPLAPPSLSVTAPAAQMSGAEALRPEQGSTAPLRLAGRIGSPDAGSRILEMESSGTLTAPTARPDVAGAALGAPVSAETVRMASLRAGTPEAGLREVEPARSALLSGLQRTDVAEATLLAAVKAELETTFSAPARVEAPSMESRIYVGEPVLSSARLDATSRITSGDALKVNAEVAYGNSLTASNGLAAESRNVPRPTLAERGRQALAGVVSPVLSTLSRPAALLGAGRVVPETPARAVASSPRAAAPQVVAGKPAPAPAPTGPLLSRLPGSAGRTRQQSEAIQGAITVSPLEISTARTLPAFHKVEKEATLSAIATQYGLPVEVLAHCNTLPASGKLAVGTQVKLPRELQVQYKGEAVKGDVASLLVGSTSVTGFRFLWEKQGGTLEWDAANQRVVAKNGKREVVLSVGSRVASVNKKEVMMDLAAFLMSGRTMVPVRLFEEGMHAQVEWEPETGRMYVAMAN